MKWLGAFLILFSFCAIAVRYLKSLTQIKEETKRLLDLLRFVKEEIRQYETPLPKIWEKARATFDYPKSFWQDLSHRGIYGAFLSYAGQNKELLSLYESVQTCLIHLGKSEKSLQLQGCEEAIANLIQKREAQQKEMPKQMRLYITFCLCIGGSIVILLW